MSKSRRKLQFRRGIVGDGARQLLLAVLSKLPDGGIRRTGLLMIAPYKVCFNGIAGLNAGPTIGCNTHPAENVGLVTYPRACIKILHQIQRHLPVRSLIREPAFVAEHIQ